MTHTIVPVALGDRAYDVIIGDGVLDDAGPLISPKLKRPRVVVISDTSVWATQGARLESSLKASGISVETILVPPGESTKNFAQLQQVLEQLLSLGVERSDTILAFGGGVVGDLVGFAAAILRRGIAFIQIPTTLLSQVDSSVGGKTAINSQHGKNLIGAFYQPVLVLADTTTLDTLPKRQALAGYAEVLKYGLIDDLSFFEWLEVHGEDVLNGSTDARIEAIANSVKAKARIVVADEREGSVRALLNLGHTFGHALEAETGYSDILYHGEGVAIGMMLALETSQKMGWVSGQDTQRVRTHLQTIGLPTRIGDIGGSPFDVETLWSHMQQDKKVSEGQITFVMSQGLGGAFLTKDVPSALIKSVLSESQQ